MNTLAALAPFALILIGVTVEWWSEIKPTKRTPKSRQERQRNRK